MIKDRLGSLYVLLFRLLYGRRFLRFGRGVYVLPPAGIEGFGRIAIGDGAYIAAGTYLAATPHTGEADCRLEIGEGCQLGRYNHLYATRRITLGRQVLTANGVYIADNTHAYQNPHVAVLAQPVRQLSEVTIGDGAWLGHNACILGASVGAHSVVGANAVVTRDIPDHCVAVGSPAIIVRRFDPTEGSWRPTRPDGRFRMDDLPE